MRLFRTLFLICGCSGLALAQTSLSLSSSPNPSAFGQTVTFTVTTQGVPQGSTITFYDGSTVIGTSAVSNSVATFSTSSLSTGSHAMLAIYSAPEQFSSNSLTQVVNRLSASVSLSSQPNPSSVGQAVVLTASLSPVGTGTVTFFDGAAQIGAAVVNGSGVATITISAFTVGSHTLTAVYSGDSTFGGGSSPPVTQSVTLTTAVTVNASPNPASIGASVTVTAVLSAPTATGTVSFFDGATSLGSAAVAGGMASIATSTLAPGAHTLTATYSGDANFPAGTSPGFTETIAKGPTQVSVSATPNPSTSGQSVTITATVTPSSATGTITFIDGNNLMGTANLSGGSASFSTSTLSIGNHSLTATYGGDANNAGTTSAPFLAVVNNPSGVLVQIASSPSGTSFTVSGTGCAAGTYLTPQSLNWPAAGSCVVNFVSPYSTQAGTQYVFTVWGDGPAANPRTIATPPQPTTYTANFTTQYLLTTQVSPAGGGTVSGGGFVNANSSASLTATPASGFRLVDWTGVPNSVSGTSPATVTVSGPETVTANFAAVIPSPPSSYILSQIQGGTAGQTGSAQPINNFGQVAVSTPDGHADLWTPFSANGTAGGSTDLGNLPVNGTPFSQAFALNDRGQVVGRTGTVGGPTAQAFLWSPGSANGQSGSMVAFLGAANTNASASGINNFGQIVGGYLWTPASANGTTGTVNTDVRLNNAVAVNDFGQAILVAGNSPSWQGTLFTPSSANGGTGTFTAITGEAGATGNLLESINRNGAIAGTSCVGTYTGPGGGCLWHGFVWTPAAANGTTGTSTVIPLPAGYVSMTPDLRINTAGQVVGTLLTATGARTPFLYTGGAIYDLSSVSAQLAGASAAGINDSGQIVTNNAANNLVFLLTPQPQPPPTPQWSITKTHNGNFAPAQAGATYTITVRNSGGVATTGVAMVTENVPAGLTLVSMTGSNWTCATNTCSRSDSLAPSAAYPPITVTVNVSSTVPAGLVNQATVSGGGAASATANDPTSISGVLSQTPVPVSLSPVVSTGSAQSYVFQFSDPAGWQTLSVVNILINNALDGRQACYLAYSVPNNVLYLVPDSGDGLLTGLVLNGSNATSNSQCTVLGAGSSFSGNGNILTLTLNMTFTSSFSGNKVIYMAARDVVNNSGWQVMGVRGVSPLPSGFPNPGGVSPSSGSTASQAFTFTYQDQNSATNLQTVWALINTAIDGRAACYVAYYRPGNQLFLYPDNGDGTQATNIVLTGNNTISNSQCTVSAQGATVQSNGGTLTVTLPITFKPAFAGFKGIWMAAQTLGGQTSPWQSLGVWNVPGN